MFLYQGWYLHKEKETSFLTLCMANFGLTATFMFEIWTPECSSASTSCFHKGIFFSFLDRMVLYLSSLGLFFPLFLPRTFFRLWFFHEQRSFHKQRASTCELSKVRGVNKIWK